MSRGRRSVETYAFVIYDFDDGSEAAGVLPVGEEDDTADFHHPPL